MSTLKGKLRKKTSGPTCDLCESSIESMREDLRSALPIPPELYNKLPDLLGELSSVLHELNACFEFIDNLRDRYSFESHPHLNKLDTSKPQTDRCRLFPSEVCTELRNIVRKFQAVEKRASRLAAIELEFSRTEHSIGISFHHGSDEIKSIISNGRPKSVYRVFAELTPELSPAKLASIYFPNAKGEDRKKHRLAFETAKHNVR